MSDPINHDALSDDLFRNRIAAALRELDQPESDADIADALDAVDVEPLGEAATSRIMRQLRRSIAETSASPTDRGQALRTDRGQALRNSELAVRPIPNSEAPDPGAIGRRLSRMVIVVACAALIAVGLAFHRFDYVERSPLRSGELISLNDRPAAARTSLAERSANSAAIQRVHLGETLSTGPREKRRVTLLDGSVLSINEQSRVTIVAERRVKLLAGEVFVEVLPTANAERFVVETPQRTVTALGTKFVVKAQEQATSVVVTQGTVQVSGVEAVIPAGQELIADQSDSPSVELRPAKRSAYVVEWVKDLLAATGSMVVPVSEHAGGTVTVVDPNGQEMKLSLRKFHVDVYIEEGFARTTIDQTYFNHTWQQLEGTFRFPLPADASLSRLAMYVNGKLMEGGMVERDYGRNVFEQIRHTQRDPALLEWVDGSTFQMRVFPLEARQEKRILLSYTQRLPNDYGRSVYRFPAGHSLEGVREWSAHLRVKGAAGTKWYSPSHLLNGRVEQEDLFLDGREEYAALDRDLVVELTEPQGASRGPNAAQQSPRVLANAANPGEPEGVSPMALTLEAERRKPSREVSQDSTKPDGL
ncbi:MAG: VIT domain-containing protein, partial [Planctomycetaceae bacterium]